MFSLSRVPAVRITPTKATAAASVGVTSLAFLMSYTALSDLAARNGISEAQSPAFPLIVDGLTIVSTLAVYAADSKPARIYAWTLLILGTAVSVAGNAAHALANGGSHIAVAIAVIPPLVQLASIHLTMTLISQERSKALAPVSVVEGSIEAGVEALPAVA